MVVKKVKIKKFIKKKINKTELKEVFKIAKELENYLNQKEIIDQITKINVKGVHSQKIQKIITDYAEPKLGFSSEKEKLFEKYESKKLRPDFYKKVAKLEY